MKTRCTGLAGNKARAGELLTTLAGEVYNELSFYS